MKKILILALAVMSAGIVWGQNGQEKTIAVYITGQGEPSIHKILGAKIVQAIILNGEYTAVERTEAILTMLRKEQNYVRTGNVDDSQIGRLGKELGANYVCIAEIVEAFGEKYISARLVDAEKAKAIKFADVYGDMNNMASLVKMSADVASGLLGGGGSSSGSSSQGNRNQSSNTQRHPAEPEMVSVQGGTFWMGCSSEQQGSCESNESPLHSVTVSNFSIAKYEVTQAQWKLIMGTSVSQQRDKANTSWPLRGEGDNYPMYYVSWNEAQEFISRLNAATGKQYRLPTEAEWEYAARGGNQSKGYKYSGSNFVEQVAWFTDNSGSNTHPVGTKQPNELGIYDMSGNVWEWCYDWFGTYPASAQQNPMGASSSSYRVIRGGSGGNRAARCRVASRGNDSPGDRSNALGLRLVLP